MTEFSSSNDLSVIQANVLDHSREFVEIVYEQAPGEFRALLSSGRFDHRLEHDPAFNHGKLYGYAEFALFRRELLSRFSDALPFACTHAFSQLFLRNNISISNVVEYVEGSQDEAEALQRLENKGI